MITVKFYGLLRIESGVKEINVNAARVSELYALLPEYSGFFCTYDLKRSIVLVNGKRVPGRHKLNDGDIVIFMSPAAGG